MNCRDAAVKLIDLIEEEVASTGENKSENHVAKLQTDADGYYKPSDIVLLPWLSSYIQKLEYTLLNKNMVSLIDLMQFYIRHIKNSVTGRFIQSTQLLNLKEIVEKTFPIFFRIYRDISKDCNKFVFLKHVSDLLAQYIDIELKASEETKEEAHTITIRLTSYWNYYLENSIEHILDTLIKMQSTIHTYQDILNPVMKKLMNSIPIYPKSDMMYLRYFLVFCLWRKMNEDAATKNEITKNAVLVLGSPPSNFPPCFLEKALPKMPKSESNLTEHISQCEVDIKQTCEIYVEYCGDSEEDAKYHEIDNDNNSISVFEELPTIELNSNSELIECRSNSILNKEISDSQPSSQNSDLNLDLNLQSERLNELTTHDNENEHAKEEEINLSGIDSANVSGTAKSCDDTDVIDLSVVPTRIESEESSSDSAPAKKLFGTSEKDDSACNLEPIREILKLIDALDDNESSIIDANIQNSDLKKKMDSSPRSINILRRLKRGIYIQRDFRVLRDMIPYGLGSYGDFTTNFESMREKIASPNLLNEMNYEDDTSDEESGSPIDLSITKEDQDYNSEMSKVTRRQVNPSTSNWNGPRGAGPSYDRNRTLSTNKRLRDVESDFNESKYPYRKRWRSLSLSSEFREVSLGAGIAIDYSVASRRDSTENLDQEEPSGEQNDAVKSSDDSQLEDADVGSFRDKKLKINMIKKYRYQNRKAKKRMMNKQIEKPSTSQYISIKPAERVVYLNELESDNTCDEKKPFELEGAENVVNSDKTKTQCEQIALPGPGSSNSSLKNRTTRKANRRRYYKKRQNKKNIKTVAENKSDEKSNSLLNHQESTTTQSENKQSVSSYSKSPTPSCSTGETSSERKPQDTYEDKKQTEEKQNKKEIKNIDDDTSKKLLIPNVLSKNFITTRSQLKQATLSQSNYSERSLRSLKRNIHKVNYPNTDGNF